ncbi:glycosyltransferase [Bizionia gelidisalsuginis]|uniref:Glycosyltransferase n=2 Tax=Bizionia TaxID=283785 RepID=A0A8H2QN11_9FLAO|nr:MULTISPECIES: glycosyltransferase [Bizionia]TYB80254.1 glycosyltransferase [Bizionia saleffrena]TYC17097.1 glycosyltransferase [Bizionia gelidisalsuginis]
MSNPVVSIIVPCYNVKDFVSKTLESVHSQDYKNWECLIINDGSQDNTASICKEWVAKDSRFKYFYQENQGLSAARNKGLEKASGSYVYFLDSDDLIPDNTLSNLLALTSEDTDIVYGKCAITEGQNKTIKDHLSHTPKPFTVFKNDSKKLLSKAIEEPFICVAWNRLIKKTFIDFHNLNFKRGIYHEDELWFFETLFHTKGIIFNDQATYFYNVANTASITNNFNIKNLESYLFIIEYLYKNYYKNEEYKTDKNMVSMYITYLKMLTLRHCYEKLDTETKQQATPLIKATFKNSFTARSTPILSEGEEKMHYHFKLVELFSPEEILDYLTFYGSKKIKNRLKRRSVLKRAKLLNATENRTVTKVV